MRQDQSEIIVFVNQTATRFLQAEGTGWEALIGACGVKVITAADLARLQDAGPILLIRLPEWELDQLQVKEDQASPGKN